MTDTNQQLSIDREISCPTKRDTTCPPTRRLACPLSTALAVVREVQTRTGLTIRNVTRQLRPLRSATIAINGTRQTFGPAIPDDQQAILDAAHGRELTP